MSVEAIAQKVGDSFDDRASTPSGFGADIFYDGRQAFEPTEAQLAIAKAVDEGRLSPEDAQEALDLLDRQA